MLMPLTAKTLAIASLLLGSASAWAADRITFGDWVLECPQAGAAPRSCQLRQTLADAAGRRVLQLSVKRAGPAAFLEAVTPLGISIPFGVGLITSAAEPPDPVPATAPWTTEVNASASAKAGTSKAGTSKSGKSAKAAESANTPSASAQDQPLALRLASCDPDGCRAVLPLEPQILEGLKAAPRLAVRFQDSKSGKILTIEGSAKGLAEGAAMVLATP